MGRLVVALDPAVDVSPAELAAAWDGDEEAREVGPATVDSSPREDFLSDVLALVAVPLVVNVASSAAYSLVSRLVASLRPAQPDQPDLEIVEVMGSSGGDRILVVRLRGVDQ